jgi:hypothetical protein
MICRLIEEVEMLLLELPASKQQLQRTEHHNRHIESAKVILQTCLDLILVDRKSIQQPTETANTVDGHTTFNCGLINDGNTT